MSKEKSTHGHFARTTLTAILTVSIYSGCANMPSISMASLVGGQRVDVPQPDPTDPCNEEVQAFNEVGELSSPLITESEIATLIVDGLMAKITGRGQGTDALIHDAIYKSLNRGTQAYLAQITNQVGDDRSQVLSTINDDARSDSRNLYSLNTKIDALNHCRSEQNRQITRDYQRGALTRAEAEQQYRLLESQIERDNAFIAKLVKQSGERVGTYIEAANAVTDEGAPVSIMYAQADVNIRSQPSTSGTSLGAIPSGNTVSVLGTPEGAWYPIEYQGRRAYVHGRYLGGAPPAVRKPSTPRPPVSASAGEGVQSAATAQREAEQKQQEYAVLAQQVEESRQTL